MGKVAHQVNQIPVGRMLATLFTGNEYEPDFFGILAGRVGGSLDEPCQGAASCRPAQANQSLNLLSSEVLRPACELIGRAEVYRGKSVNDY
jgi:hypothetical protein